jgi:agmatinase
MKVLTPKDGFLGLDLSAKENRYPENNVVIIPFGLEASVSYGQGTSKGPLAIISASHQVELFDEDLWCEPYKHFGIETLAPFSIETNIPAALGQLEKLIAKTLSAEKFPLILGGEHSLSVGSIRAIVKKFKKITILHFDAHADLRNGYGGEHFSHASAMRRCLDIPGVSVVSCGIRNISAEEVIFLEENRERIHIFWGKDKSTWDIDEINNHLGSNPIYISFDLDGFDSSLMPATGTPEPGGMLWDDAINIVKRAAQTHTVVGADIVELAPHPHLQACNFLAAKLTYKILSYTFVQ